MTKTQHTFDGPVYPQIGRKRGAEQCKAPTAEKGKFKKFKRASCSVSPIPFSDWSLTHTGEIYPPSRACRTWFIHYVPVKKTKATERRRNSRPQTIQLKKRGGRGGGTGIGIISTDCLMHDGKSEFAIFAMEFELYIVLRTRKCLMASDPTRFLFLF